MSVCPGQEVPEPRDATVLALGGGLMRTRDGKLLATLAGPVRSMQRAEVTRMWVADNRRRHEAALEDVVVGIVLEHMGETYTVDINSTRLATLDVLAFDGASRRNCPDLQPGALVFARVVRAMADVEPQISCKAGEGMAKKDWTSGESTFGELKGGMIFNVPRATCRALSMRGAPLLESLGRAFPFEIAVGLNGRIWVSADHSRRCVIMIGEAVRQCAGSDYGAEETDEIVAKLMSDNGMKPTRKKKKAATEEEEEEDDDELMR